MVLSTEVVSSPIFNWFILPLLIFFSRMCDVTLGTLRHIFLAKGIKKIVPILGFCEVLIWIIVVKQVMNPSNNNNWACYIGWAGGFAMGTVVGMYFEEKLALGVQVVRIITNQNFDLLLEDLRKSNVGITVMDGEGAKGPVKIIFTVIKRKDLEGVVQSIQKYNPNAFYSIEDVKEASQGVFPGKQRGIASLQYFRNIFPLRK